MRRSGQKGLVLSGVSRANRPLRYNVEGNDMRDIVLAMLKAGFLTQSEAAKIAGVTRQCMGQWVRKERIQPIAARAKHLRELVRNAQAN